MKKWSQREWGTKMINNLTKEQEQKLIEHREEYLKWGLCCDTADKELAIKSITEMYKLIDKKPPYFWFCDSPIMIQLVIQILKNIKSEEWTNLGDNLGDNIRNSDLWGQMDLYWICYYQFPRKYLNITYKKEYSEILDLWDNIGRSIGWWYPYENICFISDRPKEIHKKGIRLHNEKGAALSFRDGYSLWFLNGIDVGEKIVMTPSEKLDPELALNEKNVDIQREIIRKIGAERMLYKLQATSIDDWTDPITGLKYSLKEMKLKSGINRKYLYYEHASLKGVFYAQPVPPEIRKACIARGYMLNMLSNEETRIEWTPQKEMITMLEIEANLPAIVS